MSNQNQNKKVLVVDDEDTIRKLLSGRLTREGYTVECAENGEAAISAVEKFSPDIIISDIKMPAMDGFQMMDTLASKAIHVPVILITGHGDKECAIEALHKGAFDYLEKPFDMNEITFAVRRAGEREALRKSNLRLIDQLKDANLKLENKLEVTENLLEHTSTAAPFSKTDMVGASDSISNIKNTIRTIAEAFRGDHDPVVLITGESGVGKEVVAKFVHDTTFSIRGGARGAKAPFVAVNCAAFPENLLESELFGYEKGAFTGALNRKLGLFEIANGGTIFLDEIGEMDLRMQVKLLRVLQERVVRRVGGTQDITVKANIVAATNKDLASAVSGKTFREDLYYRLNTLPLVIPPLRSRPEDIMPLAEHFLKSIPTAKRFKGFSSMAQRALHTYKWPGNVRELRSVIERAAILEKGPQMELMQLRQETMRLSVAPGVVTPADQSASQSMVVDNAPSSDNVVSLSARTGTAAADDAMYMVSENQTFADIRKDADERFVKDVLMKYLTREQGNVSAVARDLKMDRANLLRMFRRFNIDPDLFRNGAAKKAA